MKSDMMSFLDCPSHLTSCFGVWRLVERARPAAEKREKRHDVVFGLPPFSPDDFGATIFSALGVPPTTRFGPHGVSGRVSMGSPIMALLE
jgi:hypothetical protein